MPEAFPDVALLAALVLVAATLYSSVGHAGASGYLAAMALIGMAPEVMRPTALAINVLVAAIGTWRFARAGLVPGGLVLPLCLGSVPAAWLGGWLSLPGTAYRALLGLVLLASAVRLWWPGHPLAALRTPPARLWLAVIGIALGLLAGLTGVGGGIFLSPLLILAGWADLRHTAGASALFILANSASGLLGQVTAGHGVPGAVVVLAPVAMAGGLLGSWLGASRLSTAALRRVLGLVLAIAGAKLLALSAG